LQQPNENVFKNITSNEAWAYGYDVETKWHSSLWKSPESLWMVMICMFESEDSIDCFFWLYGIVLCEFIPVGEVVNLILLCGSSEMCEGYGKENDHKCGLQECGTSIMTVHQPRQHVDFRIFGKEFNSWPSTSIHLPDYSLQTFFCSLKV
jgi:hypothetical protein